MLKPEDESSERSKLLDHTGDSELETVINTEDGVKIGTLRKNIRSSRIGPFLRWTDSFKPGNIPVVLMYIASAFSTALLSMLLFDFANVAKWWYIILIIFFGIIVIVCLTFMMMFQQDDNITTYKVPTITGNNISYSSGFLFIKFYLLLTFTCILQFLLIIDISLDRVDRPNWKN